MKYEGLVYINTSRNYYARWTRNPRTRTHAFEADEPFTQYWVEVLRATPELLEEKVE